MRRYIRHPWQLLSLCCLCKPFFGPWGDYILSYILQRIIHAIQSFFVTHPEQGRAYYYPILVTPSTHIIILLCSATSPSLYFLLCPFSSHHPPLSCFPQVFSSSFFTGWSHSLNTRAMTMSWMSEIFPYPECGVGNGIVIACGLSFLFFIWACWGGYPNSRELKKEHPHYKWMCRW